MYFYLIDKCPKCGKELVVNYGYNIGFDSSIEGEIEILCSYCGSEFYSGANHIKEDTVNIQIDGKEIEEIEGNILGDIFNFKEENLKTVDEIMININEGVLKLIYNKLGLVGRLPDLVSIVTR